MIEIVSIVAGLVCAFCIGYRIRGQRDAAALEAASEALGREPVALIVAWPLDDPGIDIPRDYRKRGQA